ncbi:hypothetical protein I5C90_06350, partial [Staphylococcus aureus]|nr:hypothetical protein [Staphylococcus aureus]
DIGYHYQK